MPDPTAIPSCSACSEPIPDPAERWPDNATGTVCQVCWEARSSRLWWNLVRLLPEEGAHASTPSIPPHPFPMDPFPDQSAVAAALALVLEAHQRWLDDEPGGVRLDLRGAYMSGAYMYGANMRGAIMQGATLPQGIVRSTPPEAEPEPEAAPVAAGRRRIVWLKRYENRGSSALYAGDQDGRAWWLILHADAPDTWTEVIPLPTYQEQP